MKTRVLAIIISILAIILCEGSINSMSAQSPYDVDNTRTGKYVDESRPILITAKFDGDEEETLAEYCRYDAQNRIIEYGCITGQFDYEAYIRMFKIHYKGEKIDSVQCKEVYCGIASQKMDMIFKKGISFYDQFTGNDIGFILDTDKAPKDLDTKSIASMRAYADSKNDILVRQFAWLYDFSTIKEWDKEKKDKEGILIYSELVDYSNEGDESYKINYSYGYCGDYSTKNIVNTSHTEYEGEVYENERNYIITETYLHTDVDPRGGK